MTVRLYVGNLPYDTTEATLREHFAPVGSPTSVILPQDRETGRFRGFAFVEFPDAELAESVIKTFQDKPFRGRTLTVSQARPREARPPGQPPRSSSGYGSPGPGGPSGHSSSPGYDRTAAFDRAASADCFAPAPEEQVRKRPRNFGVDALPRNKRGAAARGGKGQAEPKRRGPIPERVGGRQFHIDDDAPEDNIENLASREPRQSDDSE